jgi:DNA-binding MarR family transcriptional regulator
MIQNDPFLSTLHEWVSVFMRNSMHNALRFSRDSGWSMSQLGALMAIHRMGTSAVSVLGNELGISNAAVSQMLDRLVQEGMISRTEDPDDRRVKQISLTERGQQMLQESLRARHSWISELAETLSESEKQEICQALEILIDHARQLLGNDKPDCKHTINK